MTDRAYDTRPRDEIVAGDRFAPFRQAPGLSEVDLRELRTLDRFAAFAEARGVFAPSVDDFLLFVEGDRSTRRLNDLRTALDRLLPEDAPARQTIRAAIRAKGGRGRACDRRSRGALRADPLLAPYRDLPGFDRVRLEDLRVLARFLGFAEARRVAVPTVEDYLAFSKGVGSSRRLRSLKSALDILLPGNPAVHVVLSEAIERKSPLRQSRAGTRLRPAAARRVPASELLPDWRTLLGRMRLGAMPVHRRAPAASAIDSTEDILRQYAHVQKEAGAPIEITVEGVRRLEASCAEHAARRPDPAYSDHGNRPATRHTVVMRLRQFGEALDLDPLVLAALREHENVLRRATGGVVPLKFGRLDRLPDLTETWGIARKLLAQSAAAVPRPTALRLLNEAAVIALWTLLPLRLRDGQLRWGRDVRWGGERWRVDIETGKTHEPLSGRLHRRLTPFLDALVLRGMDPAWLGELRGRAMAEEFPLFRAAGGRMLARGYPSSVWRKHLGTGAHISRSRIHTELGQLGPEAVDAALALNAQSDFRTTGSYRGKAVDRAMRRKGQDMIEALMEECLNEDGPER